MEALLKVAVIVVAIVAFAVWLFAALNWLRALGHRREGITLGKMLTSGTAAFDERSFTDEGQPYRRRFTLGFAAFFACLLIAVGLIAAQIAMAPPSNDVQQENVDD